MKLLALALVAFGLAGCFRTVLPGPDGKLVQVKTPCDADIWMVTKRYGKPDQVVLRDNSAYQIRYWYGSARTVYFFGWYNPNGECRVAKEIRLTANGIQ